MLVVSDLENISFGWKKIEYLHSYGIWWKNGAYKIYACKQSLYLLLTGSWNDCKGNIYLQKQHKQHMDVQSYVFFVLFVFYLPSLLRIGQQNTSTQKKYRTWGKMKQQEIKSYQKTYFSEFCGILLTMEEISKEN